MSKIKHRKVEQKYPTKEELHQLISHLTRKEYSKREISDLVEKIYGITSGIHGSVRKFVEDTAGRRFADTEPMKKLLGLNRSDSSLMQEPLNWKMSLSERIATETIARLLMMGDDQTRAQRVQAFLLALGMDFNSGDFGPAGTNNYMVHAEVPAGGRRIDLKFVWRNQKQKECVLVIEAKFGHKVTDGQLECYRQETTKAHRNSRRWHLLLSLDEGVLDGKKTDPRGGWEFCSWSNLWLRFENLRPNEDDLSMKLFLRTLWTRIGGMNSRDAYAGL